MRRFYASLLGGLLLVTLIAGPTAAAGMVKLTVCNDLGDMRAATVWKTPEPVTHVEITFYNNAGGAIGTAFFSGSSTEGFLNFTTLSGPETVGSAVATFTVGGDTVARTKRVPGGGWKDCPV